MHRVIVFAAVLVIAFIIERRIPVCGPGREFGGAYELER